MTAALLADDRIKDRRTQFRREESRRAFFSPLTDESHSLGPPGNAITRESVSAALLETAEVIDSSGGPALLETAEPAPAPDEAEPHVGGFSGGAGEPVAKSANESPAADADELLSDLSVRELLRGKAPTRRNRDIFRAVVVARRSQRDVAAEFDITQPRVSQIVQQVTLWLSQNVVEQDQARGGLEQIQLVENLVRMQYDHLYATALDLLHGRSTEAPAANGQDGQSHKPSAAFLNAAIRAVNSRAKFEGVNGRAARRASDEAEQRGVSMFGPTNDHLRRDDGGSGHHRTEERHSGPSYNPLSREATAGWDEPARSQDVSEGFREGYAEFSERFQGDYDARAAYYRTQTAAVFGPYDDDEDSEEEERERIEWLHEMDLRAANTDRKCREIVRRATQITWTEEGFAQFRRLQLIKTLREELDLRDAEDAEGLLADGEYDDATGRFGWDLRFQALRPQ